MKVVEVCIQIFNKAEGTLQKSHKLTVWSFEGNSIILHANFSNFAPIKRQVAEKITFHLAQQLKLQEFGTKSTMCIFEANHQFELMDNLTNANVLQ